ncbi:cytochrome C oxidase subunit IV family protein [Atopomonas sediminilitoris]|uniref:cytochrome C oxidase subunit IV family protein n=1 Tax=Atopomonas sediminilitoris TaxID=2919919 RepID=UPI001F4D76A6|nr:cytochrome C oxidase subunit IV family protein [Atopomonas sediminilitoris]MCJ8170835.1 hypothetical protein [Atopomonas sediminilitoris]
MLLLLSLTVVPGAQLSHGAWAALVFVVLLGKSWLISERFMELKQAPWLWRGALLLWPCLLGALLLGLWSARL